MTIAYVPAGPAGVAAVTLGHSRRHLPAHHAARDPGRRTATAPATVPSTNELRQLVENYAYLSPCPLPVGDLLRTTAVPADECSCR